MNLLTEKLNKTVIENEIDYLDVLVKDGYSEKYRFLSHGARGNEFLRLYSMSKGITITAAMRLIERGKMSLSDKVSDYFAPFKDCVYEKDGKILKNPVDMTVKHLFTMTSGLDYEVEAKEITEITERIGKGARLLDYVPAFAKRPLSFVSGEKFKYSLSHDLLAAIVEKVADIPFEEYVEKEIFIPLGMKSSTFRNVDEGIFKQLSCDTDGIITPAHSHNALLFSPSYTSGGAGMNSTVSDYAKFVSALTMGGKGEDGYPLLTKNSVDAIATPILLRDFIKEELFWLPNEYSYGLGVRVRTQKNEAGIPEGEFGWDGAAGSFWLADPKNKISVVIGMNILSWENRYRGIHFKILNDIYSSLII